MRRARRSGAGRVLKPASWHWVLATWFGSGFSPFASGTAGTAATLPLVWLLGLLAWQPACLIAALLLFYPGVIAATALERATGKHDDGRIVVDETVGTLLTFAFLPAAALHLPLVLFAGFFLFRLFDVWKPWIIDMAQSLPHGWGVMTDDVLAGIAGGVLLRLILPWLGTHAI